MTMDTSSYNYGELSPRPEPVYAHHVVDVSNYKDNIRYLDMSGFMRTFGFRLHRHSQFRRLWCVNDSLGACFAVFTWCLIVFGELLVTVPVISTSYQIYFGLQGAFSYICAFLGFVAHVRATFCDPVTLITKS